MYLQLAPTVQGWDWMQSMLDRLAESRRSKPSPL